MYSFLLIMLLGGTTVSLYFHLRYQNRPSYSKAWITENIRDGMSKSEVQAILGKPQDDKGDGWIYYIRTPGDDGETSTRIFLFFDGGRVSRISVVSPTSE